MWGEKGPCHSTTSKKLWCCPPGKGKGEEHPPGKGTGEEHPPG